MADRNSEGQIKAMFAGTGARRSQASAGIPPRPTGRRLGDALPSMRDAGWGAPTGKARSIPLPTLLPCQGRITCTGHRGSSVSAWRHPSVGNRNDRLVNVEPVALCGRVIGIRRSLTTHKLVEWRQRSKPQGRYRSPLGRRTPAHGSVRTHRQPQRLGGIRSRQRRIARCEMTSFREQSSRTTS